MLSVRPSDTNERPARLLRRSPVATKRPDECCDQCDKGEYDDADNSDADDADDVDLEVSNKTSP